MSDPPNHGLGGEIRTATIRIPGALGLVFAIPVFLVLGVVALACLVAGLTAVTVAPWLLRHRGAKSGHDEPDAENTITLDRAAYRTVDDPHHASGALRGLPESAAITRRPRSR